MSSTTRRSNAWQLHVKQYAHDHGISYRKAMQESECKSTYHASKVTKNDGEHKVEFKTSNTSLEKPTKRLTRKRMEKDLEDIEKAMIALKKNSKQYKTLKEQTHSLRLRLASKPPKKTKPTSEPPSEPPEPTPTPEPQPEPSQSESAVE